MPPFSKSPKSGIVIYRIVYANPGDLGQNYIVYGGTTDSKDQRVLNRFFNALDNQRPQFPCENSLFETDPAPGARKISTIEYGLNENSYGLKQTVYEGESFNFRYHVTDIKWGGVPITDWTVHEKFNRALRSASFVTGGRDKNGGSNGNPRDAIRISNETFGFDPDVGKTKWAKVEIGWNATAGSRQMTGWTKQQQEGSWWPDAASYWDARQLDSALRPSYFTDWVFKTEPSWEWYKGEFLRDSKL